MRGGAGHHDDLFLFRVWVRVVLLVAAVAVVVVLQLLLLLLLLSLPSGGRRASERARSQRRARCKFARAAAALAEERDEVAPRGGRRGGVLRALLRASCLAGLDQAVEQVLAACERLCFFFVEGKMEKPRGLG